MKQIHKFYFTVLIIFLNALTLWGTTINQNDPIIGSYKGIVFNNGNMDKVITTFFLNKNGCVTGTYIIDEEEGKTTGELTDIENNGNDIYMLHWKDKYGTGALKILFSSDYKIFLGFWGNDKNNTSFLWNGMKE